MKGKRVVVFGPFDGIKGVVISEPSLSTTDDFFVLCLFNGTDVPRKVDVDFLTFEDPTLFEGYRA